VSVRIEAWCKLFEELIKIGKVDRYQINPNGLKINFDSYGIRYYIKFNEINLRQKHRDLIIEKLLNHE